MDTATNVVPAPDVFTVHRAWDFTRAVLDGQTVFSFHSGPDCPGYEIRIAEWCLRPAGPVREPEDLAIDLVPRVRDAAGPATFDAICEENPTVMQDWADVRQAVERHRPIEGLRERAAQGVQLTYDERLAMDWVHTWLTLSIEVLLVPRFLAITAPLVALTFQEGRTCDVERRPWPSTAPPATLRHLSPNGFPGRCRQGILAVPRSGDRLWIVSSFSECDVELGRSQREALCQPQVPGADPRSGHAIPPGYLTKAQAARYTGLAPRTLDYARARGDLPFHRVSSRRVLFRLADLDRWLSKSRIDVR